MKSVLIMAMAILLGFTAGCAKKTTTVNTPEGKIEVRPQGNNIKVNTIEGKVEIGHDGHNVNIESKDGKVEISREGKSKDLGVPVYPGASQEGSMAVTGTAKNEGNTTSVVLSTKDPFDKVVAYYKEQIPQAKTTNLTTPDNFMAMFELEKDEKMIHLSIVSDKKREVTTISIVEQAKEKKE